MLDMIFNWSTFTSKTFQEARHSLLRREVENKQDRRVKKEVENKQDKREKKKKRINVYKPHGIYVSHGWMITI